GTANQLAQLYDLGLFAEPLPSNTVSYPNPHDEIAPLEARARAYLHVNCGHCHSRGGGGSSFFDVQFHLPLAKTSLIGSRPTQGTFGILGAEIIASGDPYRSVLYYRMSKLGHGRMPQFGSQAVDSRGTKLIRDWIASLKSDSLNAAQKTAEQLRTKEQEALAGVERPGTGDPDNLERELARLLSTPSGALLLVESLDNNRHNRQQISDRGYAHSDPAIRDLFERFIPEEKRLKRLGGAIKPTEILALPGDAARGRDLFFNSAGLQCKNCHKIGDQGQALGPELSQIGKKL